MSSKGKLIQSLNRRVPAWGRHVGKWVLLPDYRVKHRELTRIRSVPRFRPTITNILGKPLEILDSASFIWMYREVFEQQIYLFRTENPRPYIIDAGANIGLSVLYFKSLYPASRIVAFEADDQVFAVLEKNIRAGGHDDIELVCRAVWSSETTLSFMSDGADGGRVALAEDRQDKLTETVRLRGYLDQEVDFLKLDIEGAETEVLEDCADLLGNVANLFVEYHSFAKERQTLDKLLGIVADAGFRVHIQPVTPSPQPFVHRDVYSGMDMQLNIFAFRQ